MTDQANSRKILGIDVTVLDQRDGQQRYEVVKRDGVLIGGSSTARWSNFIYSYFTDPETGQTVSHTVSKHDFGGSKDRAFTALRRWIVGNLKVDIGSWPPATPHRD